ncbi:MAG: nucleotide pyrophosphohydrolase [Anaerolineae bacterium]|nr:nucleotide pyrophosphohydrolase [Anaerolineae bacterium]
MSDIANPGQASPAQPGSLGNSLTLQELTDAMNAFVAAMGWYRPDSPCKQSPRNIAISLSLEAAEVLEHYQWGEHADGEALSEELADVLLYLLQLAYLTEIDLGDAVMAKLSSNYKRFGPSPTQPGPA